MPVHVSLKTATIYLLIYLFTYLYRPGSYPSSLATQLFQDRSKIRKARGENTIPITMTVDRESRSNFMNQFLESAYLRYLPTLPTIIDLSMYNYLLSLDTHGGLIYQLTY